MDNKENSREHRIKQVRRTKIAIVVSAIAVVVLVAIISIVLVFNKNEKDNTDASTTRTTEANATTETILDTTTEGITETTTENTTEATTEETKGNGHIVVLDPGHQSKGDSTKEPNGQGSSTMKARVTGGTRGTTTGVSEYQLNLDIALKLQTELENRGYTVYMTRTTNDVNISNKERAEYATSVGGEISVRIHANGSDSSSVSGALALMPSSSNPYVSNLSVESQKLSEYVLDSYCASTGMNNQGAVNSDTMTGINWCTVPVTILEMGYMTNPNDDSNMQNAGFQTKMVTGIADGIDKYFGLQ